MNSKLIFEIPVYSETIETFQSRWSKDLYRSIEYSQTDDVEEYTRWYKMFYGPQMYFKYNRIIGVIEINVTINDIVLDIYKSRKLKFPYRTSRKTFLEFYPTTGNHFRIAEMTISNEDFEKELVIKIINQIKYCKEKYFKSVNYIDYARIEERLNYINFDHIIKDLQKLSLNDLSINSKKDILSPICDIE